MPIRESLKDFKTKISAVFKHIVALKFRCSGRLSPLCILSCVIVTQPEVTRTKQLSLFRLVTGRAIPLQVWTGPEGSRSLWLPDFKQSAHEDGKFVSCTYRSPLPPRRYSWYSILLRCSVDIRDIVRPVGLCQWKIVMTMSGNFELWYLLSASAFNFFGEALSCILKGLTVNTDLENCGTGKTGQAYIKCGA
jgi:hypothetical protein